MSGHTGLARCRRETAWNYPRLRLDLDWQQGLVAFERLTRPGASIRLAEVSPGHDSTEDIALLHKVLGTFKLLKS